MLGALADLVLPRRCAGCGRPGSALCVSCVPSGRPLEIELSTLRAVAAGCYEGALRQAVLAYKERGRRELAAPLAALLAGAILNVEVPGIVLVPAPSARAAARRREGDHVLRLARLAGRRCGLRTVRTLDLVREVRDSAGLGVAERHLNLGGAMAAGAARRRPAVIIDDIVTTGATLSEAARALRSAGWRVAGAVVIAATPLRRGQARR